MNQEQITKLIEVLEVGRDAAHEVAQRFHDEMKGYREAEHKQVDKDVADLNEAIAMLEAERALLAAAPAPIQQEPAAPVAWQPSEEQFESWRSRHGLHHSHNEAFYDAASLYLDATPPTPAVSQSQAAGDAMVSESAVSAFIAFADKTAHLHHPDVPYHGTVNGDSEEAWHRRVVKAALEVAIREQP